MAQKDVAPTPEGGTPQRSSRPATLPISIRLHRDKHQELAKRARDLGISQSAAVQIAVSEWLDRGAR